MLSLKRKNMKNEDQEKNRILTKTDVNRLYRRFTFNYNRCGNFENWHGNCYAWSLIPMFKKFYGVDSQEFRDGVKRHMDFHNNEPLTASLIEGIMIGMEEEKAMGSEVDPEVIRSTKASLMGPVSGIGDSLVQGTIVPLILSIAISLTGTEGNYSVLGPIFYLVVTAIILYLYSHTLFTKGYELGKDAVSLLAGSKVKQIREAIQIFGVMLVGALSASYCAPKTVLQFSSSPGVDPTTIQSILDGIFPNLLGLLLTLLCYWLMTKKKVSIFKMILITMLGTVALTYAGII